MHRYTSALLAPNRKLAATAAAVGALATTAVLAPGALAANVGEFETLPSSPANLTSETIDPSTQIIYAQENEGKQFFSYSPRTREWTKLAEAPIDSGDNGGAAYLDGKIYISYAENSKLDVYDIASGSWTTIANPLREAYKEGEEREGELGEPGTADIAAAGGYLYVALGNKLVRDEPVSGVLTELAKPPIEFTRWGGLHPYEGVIYGHQGNDKDGFAAYDIASNEWSELPSLPEGAGAGGGIDPVSGTYFAEGPYGGNNFYEYNIASKTWTTIALPFSGADAGMAYVSIPGLRGMYLIQGESERESEEGPELAEGFARFVTPKPQADLAASETVSSPSVGVGGEVTYTVTVSNDGPEAAEGVALADTLPSNATLVLADPSQGSCTETAPLSCSLGLLESGASASVSITVRATSAGAATNVAEVSSENPDPHTANNSASTTSTVSAPPETPVAQPTTRASTVAPATSAAPPRPKITIESVGKLVEGGKVAIELACSEAACSGKLSIARVHGRLVGLFFAKPYSLAAGTSETVDAELSREGMRRLQQANGELRIRVRGTAKGGNITHGFVALKLQG